MSNEPPKATPPMTTRPSATIVTFEELEALRDLKLARRGMNGDVGALIEWLSRFGGPEWRLPVATIGGAPTSRG